MAAPAQHVDRESADARHVMEFFDSAALTYADDYFGSSPEARFYQRRKEIVLQCLSHAGGRLLDLGCGPGQMVEACVERGFVYVGVDISPGMIAECRRRHAGRAGVSFTIAAMQQLPFPNGSFDVVICMGALEYLTGGAEAQAVAEIGRVLRHGGLLVVGCLNARSIYWAFDYWYGRLRRCIGSAYGRAATRLGRSMRTTPPTAPSVPFRTFRNLEQRRLLARSGFSVGRSIFFGAATLPLPFERRLPQLEKSMNSLLDRVASGPPQPLAKGFVISARRQPSAAPAASLSRAGRDSQRHGGRNGWVTADPSR